MNEFHSGREVLLVAFAFYLLTSWAQLQATQKPLPVSYGFSAEHLRSSLIWYVDQIGANERNESWFSE